MFNPTKHINRLGLFIALASSLMLSGRTAQALDIRNGNNVVIAAGEVIDDDLYISASSFTLDGTVNGDLIVVAQVVTINGTVHGNINALAQVVTINGAVDGSVQAAGQAVLINGAVDKSARVAGGLLRLGPSARIGRDLVAAGASIETKSGSTVGKDLYGAGAEALLQGNVARNLSYAGGNLSLQGRTGGHATLRVGSSGDTAAMQPYLTRSIAGVPPAAVVPSGLTLGSEAMIGGALDYESAQPLPIANQLSKEVHYAALPVRAGEAVTPPQNAGLNWLLNTVRSIIALAAVGALLMWLLPGFVSRVTGRLAERPLASAGWGALMMFVIPAVATFATLAGLSLSVLLTIVTLGNLAGALLLAVLAAGFAALALFVLALSYLTFIVVANWLGQSLLGARAARRGWHPIVVMLCGLVPMEVLASLPIVGWGISLLIMVLGLGALWLHWFGTARVVPTQTRESSPYPREQTVVAHS